MTKGKRRKRDSPYPSFKRGRRNSTSHNLAKALVKRLKEAGL